MAQIPLSDLMPHEGGVLVGRTGGAVLLITDPRPWAYSAKARFELPGSGQRPHTLKIRATVESGAIGIGWLPPDWSGWVNHRQILANGGRAAEFRLAVPPGAGSGTLIFDNQNADGGESFAVIEWISVAEAGEEEYRAALAAEERGDISAAIEFYKDALREDPSHSSAIAGLGRLRYVDPATPVVDEIRRWLPEGAVFDVTIEIRNPCNYRCFYCICKGQNNTPVQPLDLNKVEEAYKHVRARMIVTAIECGGGEPTVHPQFPELLRICSAHGYVSFPTNNSQDPKRWLPRETARRITVRSAVHPEAEGNLDRYCSHARYLIEAGCNFVSLFIAHPTRISKIPEYRAYFQQQNVPFTTMPFGGDYKGRVYPHSYTEEQKELVGLGDPSAYWIARVDPHVTRIRNFRGIPCTAGQRSVYIKAEGTLLRCMFDQERHLQHHLRSRTSAGSKLVGAVCGWKN